MLKRIDQAFGVLLLFGGCGHTAGTLLWLPAMSGMWVWSLGAALAVLLLGALNLVRAARPHDRTIALIAVVGTAIWAVLALAFGKSINNLLDVRALVHFVNSAVLVFFGILTLRGTNSTEHRHRDLNLART
ncbi:MAG: hypothetical protein JO051_03580 [Acidobacteriaceae bacterium]|nr:hypothetical protein [Acidobacteriaceae bacterium]